MLGSTTFMSCEKETEPMENHDSLNSDALNVGLAHNKSLCLVFAELQNLQKTKSTLSESDYINFTIQSSKKYLVEEEGLSIDKINEIYSYMGIDNLSKKSLKSSDNIIDVNLLINSIEDEEYKSLLVRIVNILENDLGSYTALDNELNKIEQDAANSIYYNEILAINSVARNSYLYWEENCDEWFALFSNGEKSINIDNRFWDIMQADVEGAIGGAFFGGIVGSLVGAPVMSGIEGIFIAIKAK